MRILQIISYLYPAWRYGGPGKLVYELSSELAKDGNNVTVYTTDAFDLKTRRNRSVSPFPGQNPQVQIFRNLSNSLAAQQKIFLPPTGCLTVWNHIQEFDVVHIQEVFTPLAAVAAARCRRLRVPFVLSAHGTLSSYHLQHRSLAKDLFFRLVGQSLYEADCFLAATEEEKKEYQSYGIPTERIAYIPNGIDTTAFASLPSRGQFRAAHKIPADAYLLLYVGRVNPLKGLDQLIAALQQFPKIDHTHLVIGGSDDGYLPTLREMVRQHGLEQRVTFTGMLAGEEKLQALADADLFVYPSPGEGFSLAILEAGAAGLPLLITDGCKFPDVLRSGAGMIVSGSARSLADAIGTMGSNRPKLKRMGQAAQRLVQRQYSIETMATSLLSLYETICKKK